MTKNKVTKLNTLDKNFKSKLDLLLRSEQDIDFDVYNIVSNIIKKIKEFGDKALLDLVSKYDGITVDKIEELRISHEQLEFAYKSLNINEKQALEIAANRIKSFHEHQVPIDLEYKDEIKVDLGMKYSPVSSAGFYVPGGKAIYPSSVLMNAIPANVAGVNDGADTEANQTRINAVYLYQGDTLLDKVSGSQLASGVATFNGFKINVPKNSSKRFMVKADFIDDTNQGNDTVQFQLTGYSVEDDESDNVYTSTDRDSDGDLVDQSAQITSARVVTIKGVGTLANAVDTTDSEVDKDKNILGGVTSGFVASYELTATNEAIEIKDFTLTNTNGVLSNAVSEVIVYANDKTTEVARETVVSGVETVTFDNANFVVAEGTSNVYVKVITHKQGKDQAGQQTADLAFTLTITDAE